MARCKSACHLKNPLNGNYDEATYSDRLQVRHQKLLFVVFTILLQIWRI